VNWGLSSILVSFDLTTGGDVLTDSRPALTPCRPVSQTSPSFSTSFNPEILIESQEYVWLEESIQGIESANAVKQESSCPSTDAASTQSAGTLIKEREAAY
jgi:hypothetical protein